ncbi:MAG TPA: pitrilysin family protein [Bacteroidota bacterium]|nr:pitrilysin family protein [Bacteroidota bacterium]
MIQPRFELDRSLRPPPLPLPRTALPAIQKATLPNGLAVWLVEHHKLPQVAFSLLLQSGADQDPAGRAGVATLTAELLDAGTQTKDLLQIAERLEFLGTSLSFRAGTEATFGYMLTLRRHLDESISIFSDELTNSAFPESEFERVKALRLGTLLQQKDRAATIATNAFMHVLYGADHPYGNDILGSEPSVTRARRADVVEHYQRHYLPGNGTLIVVGDITLEELMSRLEASLGSWRGEQTDLRLPPAPAPVDRCIYLIDRPGAVQSEIRIGCPALPRATPDYFAATVMNRILGGQFSSRINVNLRERRGLTYGARSAFVFLKTPGPFFASGGFISEKTDTSVEQLVSEIDRLYRDGVTEEELAFSKKGLVGSFALSFETISQIAAALQTLVLYGLPEDYYGTYLENIDRVTLEDIRRVAAGTLDSRRMAVLVVGDAGRIRGGLSRLGLGDVRMLDAEGNPAG